MKIHKEKNSILSELVEESCNFEIIDNFSKLEEFLKIKDEFSDTLIMDKIYILIKNALEIRQIIKNEKEKEEPLFSLFSNFQSIIQKLNKPNILKAFELFFLKKISSKKVTFKEKNKLYKYIGDEPKQIGKYISSFFSKLNKIMSTLRPQENICTYLLYLKNHTEKKKEIFEVFSLINQLGEEQKSDFFSSIPSDEIMLISYIFIRTSFLFSKKEFKVMKEVVLMYIEFLKIEKKHLNLLDKIMLEKESNDIINNLFYNQDNSKDIRMIIFREKVKLNELYKLYLINNQFNFLKETDEYYLAFYLYIKFRFLENNVIPINRYCLLKDIYTNQKIKLKDLILVKDSLIFYDNKNIYDYSYNEPNFLEKRHALLCKMTVDNLNSSFITNSFTLNKLLLEKSFNYTSSFIELTQIKEECIFKDFSNFKNKLLELEKFFIQKFREFKGDMEEKNQDIFYHVSNSLNKLQIESYARILNIIEKSHLTIDFDLIPYGSVIQFLGKDDSDLDLYVSLISDDSDLLCKNWLKILHAIENKYPSSFFQITKRLCIIKFTDENGVKIDLNYFGKCGVINSHLVRYYSLIDVRFSILVYIIKYILKQLKISNSEKIIYLNSYSWVFILITFLQDVIEPPILPKLLDMNSFIDFKFKVFDFKASDRIHHIEKNKKILFKQIFNREQFIFETYNLYEFPINYKEIYEKFLKENGKNNSSLAVIFLNFIEYMTMRFNPESMYFDTKLQKVRNKSEVTDESQKKYFMKNIKLKRNLAKYYIRDVFDHTYNPAKDMNEEENYNTFKEKLITLYKNILQKGLPF